MKTERKVRMPSAERKLGQIGRSIDELLTKSRTAETAAEVRDNVVKELKRIDKQIAATRAQIGQDLATTREDLVEALHKELDVWKVRLEELDVQAALGRMELQDRLAPIVRRVDATLARVRRDVEELAEAEIVDEEELGYSIQKAMTDLRKEIEEVDEMC